MATLPQSEIKAIVRLLKTKDESTSKLILEQLGTFDVKLLRDIDKEISLDDKELKDNFIKYLKKIKREQLKKELSKWAKSGFCDLEEGVFILASFENPLINFQEYSTIFDEWASVLSENIKKVKLPNDSTSIINEVNHFLFMELGFKGNKSNYYDPANSFIDKVIERKTGNPILLSAVYLLLTKRTELPFKGVNMPSHFLVQYADSFDPIYVDPFNQGEIITRADCMERIKTLNLTWNENYLLEPTNKQTIARMIQNLINIYNEDGQIEKKEYFEEYVKVLKV